MAEHEALSEHDSKRVLEAHGLTYDDWVVESGLKLRVQLGHSPLKFLTKLGTDFWGFRLGLKSKGLLRFDDLVADISANAWWQNTRACIADRATGEIVLASGLMRSRNFFLF